MSSSCRTTGALGDRIPAPSTRLLRGARRRLRAHPTDNGSAYLAHAYALACFACGLRHTRTRPRRPRTNGEAKRFLQTMLAEWAYARLYATSDERAGALPLWLNHYNYRRPHGSLSHRPAGSRLNNVARNYN
jgi:transposase InsO family protein